MRIDILTVVPELLVSPLNESILKRAQQESFMVLDSSAAQDEVLTSSQCILRENLRLVEAKQTLESLKANYKEEDDIKVLIDAKMEGLEN